MSRHAAFVLLAPCSHALASASAGIPPPAVAVSACHPHRCCPVVLALAVVVADLLGVVVVVFRCCSVPCLTRNHMSGVAAVCRAGRPGRPCDQVDKHSPLCSVHLASSRLLLIHPAGDWC